MSGIEVRWTPADSRARDDELRDVQVPMSLAPDDEAWEAALRGKVG
ncbi:hypothetical protein ACIQNU_28220 [Streptomyces sp. NPDC091292]